ncbi:MAG: 50S ribosomal protein L11 methyltransferase [Paracoccaceae bacterium]
MATFTAFTVLAGESEAEQLGLALERLDPEPMGIGVFVVEDGSGLWEVGGYFTAAPDEPALLLLAAAFGAKPFVVSELPETDWVSHVKRELSPVEAGRFYVHGSHDATKVPTGSVGLLIEASMAFGTGHHGTTLGCLQALEQLMAGGFVANSVADIGSGTAVLAMAAAHCYAGPVFASDIDPVAVDVARANVMANRLDHRVVCLQASGFDHAELKAAAPFDLVFANILKGPLIELAPAMEKVTKKGSQVILSGILTTQADAIVSVYARYGYNLANRRDIVEWTTLTLEKIRP